MGMLDDFKKFAIQGNVTDLAVGVVIGGAFGKIVTAVVGDVVMPLVSLALPSGDWRTAGLVLREAPDPKNNVVLKYGDLIGSVLDFLVIAFVLFLVVSKLMTIGKKPTEPAAPAAPTTKECTECLETIPIQAKRCRACGSAVAAAA
jgi:large conductance mechanosensitive channel